MNVALNLKRVQLKKRINCKYIYPFESGLLWLHVKIIMKQGATSYLTSSANLHEAVIIMLYVAVFFLQWNGRVLVSISSASPRYCRLQLNLLTINIIYIVMTKVGLYPCCA